MSESNEQQQSHTPGKLSIHQSALLLDQDGVLVADLLTAEGLSDNSTANARRLAACWNALQDFPTEAIELIAAQPNAITRVSAVYCVANQVGDRVAESMPSAEYEAALAGSAELGAKLALDIQPVLDSEFGELRDDERAEVLRASAST